LVGRKCARFLIQKKVKKSSKTGTKKKGCMIVREEELVEKAERETKRNRVIEGERGGKIEGGWGEGGFYG
jgi:hypothetical protein